MNVTCMTCSAIFLWSFSLRMKQYTAVNYITLVYQNNLQGQVEAILRLKR